MDGGKPLMRDSESALAPWPREGVFEMRKLALALLALGSWLSVPGCMFAHDSGCVDDGDCKGNRICDAGDCVDRSGVGPEGFGGTTSPTPSEGKAGTTSLGSSGSEAPSCTDLRSGTQTGTAPDSVICNPSTRTVSVSIATGGEVQSIAGESCTLSQVGTSCYETVPDQYECGSCLFDVNMQSIDGSTPVGWSVSAHSCASSGCAEYCCASESGIMFAADYWLDQLAPGGSSGGGTPTPGGSGGNPRDPCNGCGFPFCDGNCAGCC